MPGSAACHATRHELDEVDAVRLAERGARALLPIDRVLDLERPEPSGSAAKTRCHVPQKAAGARPAFVAACQVSSVRRAPTTRRKIPNARCATTGSSEVPIRAPKYAPTRRPMAMMTAARTSTCPAR